MKTTFDPFLVFCQNMANFRYSVYIVLILIYSLPKKVYMLYLVHEENIIRLR